MNRPTRFVLAVLFLAPAAGFAAKAEGPKAKAMAKYDLNHDGKLDGDELGAIRRDFAAAPTGDLVRFDTDKDGKLSAEEIVRMVPGSGRKSGGKGKATKTKDAASEAAAAPDKE